MRILRRGIKNGSRVFCDVCGVSHAVTSLTDEGDLTIRNLAYNMKGHNYNYIYIRENYWHIAYSKRVIRKRTGEVDCTGYVAYCAECFREMRNGRQNPESETDADVILADVDRKYNDDSTLIVRPQYMNHSTIMRCQEFDRMLRQEGSPEVEASNTSNSEPGDSILSYFADDSTETHVADDPEEQESTPPSDAIPAEGVTRIHPSYDTTENTEEEQEPEGEAIQIQSIWFHHAK